MKLLLVLCVVATFSKAQTYNCYFGNIHAHTAFSDGNKDSSTSGVSTPAGSYAFAKLSQNFDFLGISEHNHYTSAHNPGFQVQNWSVGLSQANAANQDGTFLTLFGMEWGVTTNYYGHVVVYGYPQLIGWESGNYQVYNAKADYDGLFNKIKNQPGAFACLAHPQTGDYTTGGTNATSLLNNPYNATWDSAIVGTPLRSGIYNTATTNYTAYPAGDYFDYFRRVLAKGYHVGCTYDHDNHNTTFGRNNGGRLVILATSLTVANFYDAMLKMRFYGSDDWNAKVNFTMNGNVMGSVLTGTANPVFNVVHNDGDGELADSIKIWRGISNNPALPQVVSTTLHNNTASYTDLSMSSGIEYYYFAEIKQNDGQWIVTSPIWYTNAIPTALRENKMEAEFNCFPNPVSQQLSISTSVPDTYSVSIIDISGRTVCKDKFTGQSFLINLSSIAPGIYTLNLGNKKGTVIKKLIVE
jgi:hypothetical protein